LVWHSYLWDVDWPAIFVCVLFDDSPKVHRAIPGKSGYQSERRHVSCLLFHHQRREALSGQPIIDGVKVIVLQEDRFHAIKGQGAVDSSLYGVFDGHGGAQASQYCKDHLLKTLLSDEMFESNPLEALKKSFHRSPPPSISEFSLHLS
jgi:hypothetical protein